MCTMELVLRSRATSLRVTVSRQNEPLFCQLARTVWNFYSDILGSPSSERRIYEFFTSQHQIVPRLITALYRTPNSAYFER